MDNFCSANSCDNPNVPRRLPRAQMPQFTRSSLKKLDAVMRKAGHTVKTTRVSPHKLRPSQKDISETMARGILKKWGKQIRRKAKASPLVVSSDGSILDGHHRWLALRFAVEDRVVPATYKAHVHMYSSPGHETLRLAKTLKTPRHG